MSQIKHSSYVCSRKTQKNIASKLKTSKSSHQTITIYAQNVFLNNSFIQNIKGDFNVEQKSHIGDLYKTAAKTPVRNLAFEKHNDKFRIMETKNPKICGTENIAVYDLSTRTCELHRMCDLYNEFGEKRIYRQVQEISEYCTVLSDEDSNGFGSVDVEKFAGNLVLNHLGWNGGRIRISSGNNDTVYTALDNLKYILNEITLTMANRTYKIYTPKIMMKLCEIDKNSGNSSCLKKQSIKPKDLACSHSVYSFTQYSKSAKKLETDASLTSVAGLTANVNRSADTVVEPTRNDWKNSDKQRAYADKVLLSKIKKNKSIMKYQAMTCY